MILRYTLKEPKYRRWDFSRSKYVPPGLQVGRIQVGDFPMDRGHGYVLDLLPYNPSAHDLLGIPARELEHADLKRIFVLRADRPRDAQYLRSMPSASVRSYRVREMLVEFQHAVDFQGLIETPEALEAVGGRFPGKYGFQSREAWDTAVQLTRINLIEVRIEPNTWQHNFLSPSFIRREEVRSEVNIPAVVGDSEVLDDTLFNVHSERMPSILLPRDVPPTLEWLRAPDLVEEPSD